MSMQPTRTRQVRVLTTLPESTYNIPVRVSGDAVYAIDLAQHMNGCTRSNACEVKLELNQSLVFQVYIGLILHVLPVDADHGCP